MSAIEAVLDLLEYDERPGGAEAFQALWSDIERVLGGRVLTSGRAHEIRHATRGTIRIRVIAQSSPPPTVDGTTQFAIHSVLEPPALRHRCSVCLQSGITRYGPFVCSASREAGEERRLCDDHVVILDGSLRPFAPDRRPSCRGSGAPATFWCLGPDCWGRVAWSDGYRRVHPGDPDAAYCPSCYAELFPACSHPGCDGTGSVRCEFVDADDHSVCGVRMCPPHARRWQVFGPRIEGFGLCPRHASVDRLSEAGIVEAIVLGTAARRRAAAGPHGAGTRGASLPSPQAFQHILRKAKGSALELRQIAGLVESMRRHARGHADAVEVSRLLDRFGERLGGHIDRDEQRRRRGHEPFERLKRALVSRGRDDVAGALIFRDYRPPHEDRAAAGHVPLLFVDLSDPALWGRLFGSQGATIKSLESELGMRIKRDSPGGQH